MEAPLLVKADRSLLLDMSHPDAASLRTMLGNCAELIKNPGRLYLYRLTACSLWGAAAQGLRSDDVLRFLETHSRHELFDSVQAFVRREMDRYGRLRLLLQEGRLILAAEEEGWLRRVLALPDMSPLLLPLDDRHAEVPADKRGIVKRELTRLGYPVVDEAGFHAGEPVLMRLETSREEGFALRTYQAEAVQAFSREGSRHGGSGVIVLPCGAGKTVVGIAVMARLGCATLILTPNVASIRQWKRELLARTNLSEELIGEYSGERKDVRPVTLATYQILTHRKNKDAPFCHMQLFKERDWGLIIYDEVHLLPAPVFRVTADIQATRRLGLTATLLREDGCEEDVFSLIGPKLYEQPWRELEQSGHLAKLEACEIRIPLEGDVRSAYEEAKPRARFRIASENPQKLKAAEALLRKHEGEPTLVIGHFLSQLRTVAHLTGSPLITGSTPHEERERLYGDFREGRTKRLVVSRVANFAIDLPEAQVAIELSGSYGSRQEETQRIGRIIRPKRNGSGARFYTLVSEDTIELTFAQKRRLFLAGQGYQYHVVEQAEWEEEEGSCNRE
ncbi:DNA repair helicase XPB [Gorillibacterium timonense]|uniref:DNA repair helicase XPB n=1 Tax=Gorillibacterium timonense TaxID=1689269 RepID=UPI00071D2F84|nr:DNA repair helicase XPB [Gorillibacterium timonense]